MNKVLGSKNNIWELLTLNNGSISILELNEGLLQIKAINLINHLPDEILKEICDISL